MLVQYIARDPFHCMYFLDFSLLYEVDDSVWCSAELRDRMNPASCLYDCDSATNTHVQSSQGVLPDPKLLRM